MATFDVDPERILVFNLGDEYIFKHYFQRRDLFEALQEYYNGDTYRFEVPADELAAIREELAEEYYELELIENLEPYCVVKDQYTDHAAILRESVANWTRDGYHFFLMKNELAVKTALEHGATRISETDLVVGV